MTFPVSVTYLNQVYTYTCETTDGMQFTCRRQLAAQTQTHDTPPDIILLEKETQLYDPGVYKVQLHLDLMREIDAFLQRDI